MRLQLVGWGFLMTRNSLGHASAARVVRSALLKGSSIAALAAMLSSTPTQAQLAGLRAALGVPTNAGQAGTPQPTVTATTPSMNQILARHQNYQARVQAAAGIVAQANAAARAAATAATQSVVDGLRPGGLVPVSVMLKSAQDPNGLSVWEGASAPTEATSGAAVNVTVNQTQSRALLSWNSFNVGANTTLTFNQQGNADWIAVNRVVGGIDPLTGLIDPSRDPRPSQILGSIKADGSVFVLNRSGVMFGANAQVDLHSLLVSSLELGSATVPASGTTQRAVSLRERNDSFLARGLIVESVSGLVSSVAGETHGDVTVGRGARINAKGGFVILAAPNVSSAGEIKTTVGGQVSLEAGTQVDATVSSGSADSVDPDVRGLILSSLGGGTVDVSGSIEAPQGFISLGTDLAGSILMNGVLFSTTSVSRNGKISLLGGTVSIGDGAAISITPDTSGATIPQSADSVAAFKSSAIDIGSRLAQLNNGRIGTVTGSSRFDLLPAAISLGKNAIISAPNATVSIGGRAGDATRFSDEIAGLGSASASIGENAVIDVSGVADVALDASRNVLEVSPAKRNELRDTPTYRDPTTDGSFTLNGATLFVDPRLSGVRADGVAWVGSPLIEAGSLLAQTGITASELMTRGGNVTLATLGSRTRPVDGITTPRIDIASSATIDFSGGWVRYAAGLVQYSKLLSADGRVIDIGRADPNDRFVAIGGGFREAFPQLSDPVVYANSVLTGASFQQGYVEGRDAGTLTIRTPAGSLDGTLHGDAVAGERQIAAGQAATAASKVAGDLRKLQATNNQLASAGMLRIQAIPGADIVVSAAQAPSSSGTILLNADRLNAAGLGGLSLQTSGKVSVDASTDLKLASGGVFNIDAGRQIRIDGKVSTPGGTITARTHALLIGNLFDASDDLLTNGTAVSNTPENMFDVIVGEGAVLSTRGRWVNDALVTNGLYGGSGYTSGGSITLTSAPHVSVFKGLDRTRAIDISGSILLQKDSLLDVSGGGYVTPEGVLKLSGKGGNVSLINETSYFQKQAVPGNPGVTVVDDGLFRSDLTSFRVTPDIAHPTGVVPDAVTATVTMGGDIRSFGFKGGGTFTLVTPDLDFTARTLVERSDEDKSTFVPLDFLDKTGFGTLSLTAWKTDIIDNVFSNGIVGKTALLATDIVQIRAGETLDLTQSILPSILSAKQINLLGAQASGTDISRVIAPTKTLGDWDNLPAQLVLGGVTELQLLGGTITGAPTASITAPKIYNAGTIRIVGGSVSQRLVLPFDFIPSTFSRGAIGVRPQPGPGGIDRGAGLAVVFGPANADGLFNENGLNALGATNAGSVLTNRDLLFTPGLYQQVYYLGLLDAGQGIVLADGSVTDLSGISIRNPRASLISGTNDRIATGRLVDGGTIKASGLYTGRLDLFSADVFTDKPFTYFSGENVFRPTGAIPALTITAEQGSSLDLSGAADTFDVQTGANSFTPTAVWSNGGSLSALGGGDVTKAAIDARGGAAGARGGTFEWLDPVLVQSAGVASGVVSADQIQAAGFDSFVARGDVTTKGDVSLALARSFLLRARDYSGAPRASSANPATGAPASADPYYAISFAASGALSITAPHIGLLGIDQTVYSVRDDPAASGTLALRGGSIDVFGAVAFRNSLSSVLLDSAADIRLIGVQPLARTLTPDSANDGPSLSGQVIAGGDLTFRAAQVYATTGSGNLQQLIESGGRATVRPFTIGSAGIDGTVRFESNGAPTPSTPYSAGSYISVLAPNIEQFGVLRAPLGRIDLGSTTQFSQFAADDRSTFIEPTQSVVLAPGSLTSVSLGGLTVPYGTTTDLTEYYFSPGASSPLTAPPAAELRLGGGTIDVQAGATVDASGGTGDLYAYEFVSGTGGSRDVLSRFNSDAFSTRSGFQYADGRQVYAIVPVGTGVSALYDPIYSADYGNLYAGEAGKTVRLDGGNGIPAGEYLLLPAQYALLPGAMRLVENVGASAPLAGGTSTLLDGSIVVAGTYGTAGSTAADWQRRSFTVQSQAVFGKYSRIEKTLATQDFTKLADRAGSVKPRLPGDAARIVINPISSLLIDGLFKTTPATGGRGSQVDIAAEVMDIVSDLATPRDGVLSLATSDLDKLNAASLFLGGVRTDLANGSTDLAIKAREINVINDAANPLRAPEILLAVDGPGAILNIADGASIVATGTLTDTRGGDYNVASFTRRGGEIVSDNSGAGAVFRLANGAERMVNRSGELAASVTTRPVTYTIGAANLSGEAMAIDTSRQLRFDAAATLDVDKIAISADDIAFSSRTSGLTGLIITPELEQAFAVADSLTIRANNTIGFTSGEHQFNNLRLYAPGVRLIRTPAEGSANPLSVTLNANDVTIGNRSTDGGVCRGGGAFSCGAVGNMLTVNTDTLTFDGGVFRTYGFDSSVSLAASKGAYYTGVGTFDVGGADLTLTTPFLVDRGTGAKPNTGFSQADLQLQSTGDVRIAWGGSSVTPASGFLAPGSRLAIGSLGAAARSITIDSALLRATAGTIEAYSASDVTLAGTASLATPSYAQSFGDAADAVTVSANGGTISLVALTGDIDLGTATRLSIGGATGSAGTLNLLASRGQIALGGTIDAAAPAKGASLNFDAGLSGFDLPSFVTGWGTAFTGDLAIRTGLGNLVLDAGQTIDATRVSLTADGGSTRIGGTIDTSGILGGAISLFARDAVELQSGALLDAHANGYAETDTRRATAGSVTLGAGEAGSIAVASGAAIDVSAKRPGDRLVGETRTDPRSLNQTTAYTFVEGDQGGKLTLRAPVVTNGGVQSVNVDFAGTVSGARDVSIEGYRRYDLATIAANPAFTGVSVNSVGNVATLDLVSTPGQTNFLADAAPGTLVDFIQNFDISASRSRLGSLSTLASYHERPGVELSFGGDINLASNWNLGAGTVDIAGAVEAKLMRPSLLGSYPDGSPRFEVVPGREAEVMQRFVSLTYRVGGKVDGEAGVLTLRAGRNLNIGRSITDGFFAFSDQTDPAYINAQLGGGLRSFNPAIGVQCGVGGASPTDCTDVLPFEPGTAVSPPRTSVNINLTSIVRGSDRNSGIAPYSAAANAPAALGLFAGGAGDPIGSAQIFPLLADGTPIDAFSIQLVGGAGPSASANPLHIDRASGGSVVVSGETTYAISSTRPVGVYDGGLQLRYERPGENTYLSGDFLQSLASATDLDSDTLTASAARVQFGQSSPAATAFMRQAAQAFFVAYPDQVRYFGPSANPTGFDAPLGLVIQFLGARDSSGVTLADRFAAKIADGSFGYRAPTPLGVINPPGSVARVRTLVRTGTGSIDVAAARDIDLRNGATPLLLNASAQGANSSNAAQAGGSAIYTIGHVVQPKAVTARVAGTSEVRTIDPANYVLGAIVADPYWYPTSAGRLRINPVYATGGGSIHIAAGQDVLGRRDVWSEAFNSNNPDSVDRGGIDQFSTGRDIVGTGEQRWRVGSIGLASNGQAQLATNIRLNPQLFSSGVGTLGGGDVSIAAGRDIRELTVALDTSVTTGDVGESFGSMVFGGGNLDLKAGHDILGGRFDVASGTASLAAGRNIGSADKLILRPQAGTPAAGLRVDNLPEIRLTDATVRVTAGGSIEIGKISALGVDSSDGITDQINREVDDNALGYYTGRSGVSLTASGDVSLAGDNAAFYRLDRIAGSNFNGSVMPASLEVTSFNGDIDLGEKPLLMVPGANGQLALLAGGTLAPVTIAVDDGDASLMPGIFSALNFRQSDNLLSAGRLFSLPLALATTTDVTKRLYHAATPTHLNDPNPVRIAVGGDLVDTSLWLAKQARISAGGDIVNLMFAGQNVGADDITRIVAGRDIRASVAGVVGRNATQELLGRSLVQGNQIVLGGPGALYVEAGRDLGPFLGSATIVDDRSGQPVRQSIPGGILAVGNDSNPNLVEKSADIYAFFGVGKGMDFDGLRETYVNPGNTGLLDGDLFVQVSDPFGNKTPDRTKPIYAPILIAWMQQNQAALLTATFGTTEVTATQAYTAFAGLPLLVQRKFLLANVYFNELQAASRPDGPSYLQYIRGYRAVNSLFPAALGYTANDLGGTNNGGTRVGTGNLDLRLATIQTTRGGDVTILGPGGDAILGSVVRTAAQAARRAYQPTLLEGFDGGRFRPTPDGASTPVPVLDIPIGFEGVLTLRGGSIRGFTDGDFSLNQSRLFTQQSGDISLWSSNGDLNAGQGPKNAANVPPIVVRVTPNGFAEVDSAGAVTGAGIAGFTGISRLNAQTGRYELVDAFNDSDVVAAQQQLAVLSNGSTVVVNGKTYRKDAPTITLIAPVGTVDAGDAGVRAGGDIFVAAARVANADNFKVGGASVGIPSVGGVSAPATPASAASALTANIFRATNPNGANDQRVRILVDVLGYYGDEKCPPDSTDPNCPKQ